MQKVRASYESLKQATVGRLRERRRNRRNGSADSTAFKKSSEAKADKKSSLKSSFDSIMKRLRRSDESNIYNAEPVDNANNSSSGRSRLQRLLRRGPPSTTGPSTSDSDPEVIVYIESSGEQDARGRSDYVRCIESYVQESATPEERRADLLYYLHEDAFEDWAEAYTLYMAYHMEDLPYDSEYDQFRAAHEEERWWYGQEEEDGWIYRFNILERQIVLFDEWEWPTEGSDEPYPVVIGPLNEEVHQVVDLPPWCGPKGFEDGVASMSVT